MKKPLNPLTVNWLANHPDRNAGDEVAAERFKEASEAYEVLKIARKELPMTRWVTQPLNREAVLAVVVLAVAAFPIFSSRCSRNFQGARAFRTARHGADLRYDLTIDLDEAYTGCQKDIVANISSTCDSCGGSGAAKGSQPVPCSGCGGMGKCAPRGFFTVERTCPACQGAGETISNPCSPCRGQGRVEKSENLSVNIPAGVDTGTRIRLSGKGEAGLRGAPSGDLYIL